MTAVAFLQMICYGLDKAAEQERQYKEQLRKNGTRTI